MLASYTQSDHCQREPEGVKVWKTHESLLTSKCRVFEPTGGHVSKGKGGYLHRSSSATETNISEAASKSQVWAAVRENGKTISWLSVSRVSATVQSRPLSFDRAEADRRRGILHLGALRMQPPQPFSLQDPGTI